MVYDPARDPHGSANGNGLGGDTQNLQDQQAAGRAADIAADEEAWNAANTGLPYVNPDDSKFASKTMANVSRAEWEDYKTRFSPYEEKLIAQIDNGADVGAMISKGNDAISQSQSRGLADIQRTNAKYGTSQDAAETNANSRSMALSAGASKAGLSNAIRTHARDRDMQIMVGSNVGAMKGIAERPA